MSVHGLSNPSSDAYRPDIDGLRAISIILVVMYHLKVGFTRGGYVGVDIFFVISGFLITGLIAKETHTSGFSFARFYERRILRLFPALFAAFLATAIASWWILFPNEYVSLGRQLASAIAFSANIFFYAGAGYFADDSAMQPLQHTWSLAVEEQFYLLFPLILLPMLRLDRRKLVAVLWLLGLASFALSVVWMRADEADAAFYLLPARAWELLLGALIALKGVPRLETRRMRNAASLIGVATIIAVAGAYNRNVPFPGWTALVPCIAAALIIHSGSQRDTWVYAALSTRRLVVIGLASYSIYVWHQPMIVLWKSWFDIYLSVTDRVILGALSMAIGFASWRYIERPFRYGGLLKTRRAVFVGAATAMASGLAVSAVLIFGQGFESRFPEDVRRLATWSYQPPQTEFSKAKCFISRSLGNDPRVDEACVRMVAGKKNYLLIGDSHASHWATGWQEALPPTINLMLASASGCKPVLQEPRAAPRCRAVMDWVFGDYLKTHKVDAVIVSASWVASDVSRVPETIRYLRQYTDRVIVLGPGPRYFDSLPRLLLRAALKQDPTLVDQRRDKDMFPLDKLLAASVRREDATYVSILDAICKASTCQVRTPEGEPMHFDYGHVTHAGAAHVARVLMERGRLPLD